jgi:hypothetical protein
MPGHKIKLRGFRLKDGKLERVPGYGLSTSMKLQQKKSRKVKPTKRNKCRD